MWLSRSLEFKLALGAFVTWIREGNEIQKFGYLIFHLVSCYGLKKIREKKVRSEKGKELEFGVTKK